MLCNARHLLLFFSLYHKKLVLVTVQLISSYFGVKRFKTWLNQLWDLPDVMTGDLWGGKNLNRSSSHVSQFTPGSGLDWEAKMALEKGLCPHGVSKSRLKVRATGAHWLAWDGSLHLEPGGPSKGWWSPSPSGLLPQTRSGHLSCAIHLESLTYKE